MREGGGGEKEGDTGNKSQAAPTQLDIETAEILIHKEK